MQWSQLEPVPYYTLFNLRLPVTLLSIAHAAHRHGHGWHDSSVYDSSVPRCISRPFSPHPVSLPPRLISPRLPPACSVDPTRRPFRYNYPPALSDETLGTFSAAAKVLDSWFVAVDPDAYIEDLDIDVVRSTSAPGWGKRIAQAADQDLFLVQPLDVLYARCVVVTKDFHTELARLFADQVRGLAPGTVQILQRASTFVYNIVKCPLSLS